MDDTLTNEAAITIAELSRPAAANSVTLSPSDLIKQPQQNHENIVSDIKSSEKLIYEIEPLSIATTETPDVSSPVDDIAVEMQQQHHEDTTGVLRKNKQMKTDHATMDEWSEVTPITAATAFVAAPFNESAGVSDAMDLDSTRNATKMTQSDSSIDGTSSENKCCTSSSTFGNSASNETEVDNGNHHTSKDYYFDSYSHHGIHEEMLKDEVRTMTYQMAISQNAHLLKNKIVLDVGCGTGILSMFAAKYGGAKHVYGVDCSNIIVQAKEIIKLNNLDDRITLIKGKMEEVELPVDKVDVIISEWMGYFLLYESMLDTVLYARDKYLVPNGVILPDKAVMYICGIEDGQVKADRIDFWDNVYGFDFTPIKTIALSEPVVDVVYAKHVITDSVPILKLDLLSCTKADLSFTSSFIITSRRNDYMHGLVAYFECAFTQLHKPVGWSTSPFSKYTHWKQTVFYLRDTLVICKDEQVRGQIACAPNGKNPRDLDINMNVIFKGKHTQMDCTLDFRLR